MGVIFRLVTPFFVTFRSEFLQYSFTALCLSAGIGVGYFSFLIGKKSLLQTILEIGEFSNELIKGNFHETLKIKSADEIGEFVSHYNDLMGILKKSIQSIQFLANDIHLTMKEQKGAQSDLSSNTQSLAEKYEALSSESLANSDNLRYSISQFNILCHSIESLMIQINELSAASFEQKKSSDFATLRTKQFENKFLIFETGLASVKQKMDEINQSSEEISKTVQVVQSISEKINLLSLNAAIESARAGENGKGFAVVSDEISKLATQTATSLKQIQFQIRRNHNEVKTGIEAFHQTFGRIEELIADSQAMAGNFQDLGEKMKLQIVNQTEVTREAQESIEISKVIQTHLEAYEKSVERTKDIIVEMNSLGLENAASAEELSAVSEEIVGITERLENQLKFYQF